MDGTGRRGWLLLGPALLLGKPAEGADRRRRRRNRPRPAEKPEAALAPPPPAPPPPAIDGPPPPSRIPGLEPAPVPDTNPRRPLADSLPRPELELGVPRSAPIFEGQSFRSRDPAPDRRPTPGQEWIPEPGASLRVPF